MYIEFRASLGCKRYCFKEAGGEKREEKRGVGWGRQRWQQLLATLQLLPLLLETGVGADV